MLGSWDVLNVFLGIRSVRFFILASWWSWPLFLLFLGFIPTLTRSLSSKLCCWRTCVSHRTRSFELPQVCGKVLTHAGLIDHAQIHRERCNDIGAHFQLRKGLVHLGHCNRGTFALLQAGKVRNKSIKLFHPCDELDDCDFICHLCGSGDVSAHSLRCVLLGHCE